MESSIKKLFLYDKSVQTDPVKRGSISSIMDDYHEDEYLWQRNLGIEVFVNDKNEFIGLDTEEKYDEVSVSLELTRWQRIRRRLLGLPSEGVKGIRWIQCECVVGKILPDGGIVFIDFWVDTSEEGIAEDDGSYDIFYFATKDDNPVVEDRAYKYRLEDVKVSPDGYLGHFKVYLDQFPEDYKDLIKRAINICDHKVKEIEAQKAVEPVL